MVNGRTYRKADNGVQWYVEQLQRGKESMSIEKIFYSKEDAIEYINNARWES